MVVVVVVVVVTLRSFVAGIILSFLEVVSIDTLVLLVWLISRLVVVVWCFW